MLIVLLIVMLLMAEVRAISLAKSSVVLLVMSFVLFKVTVLIMLVLICRSNGLTLTLLAFDEKPRLQ